MKLHTYCTSMSTVTYIPSNIVLLTAPQLLGMMFNWGLFGILTAQVYIYHLFFKDSIWVRVLVYTLYFLELVQIGLSTADIIYWFSQGWGRLDYLSNAHLSPIDMPLIAGVVAMTVQLYFTWRIWILSSCRPLCILIGAVSIAQGAAGLVAGVQALIVGDLIKLSKLLSPKIWLAGAALADTMIAVSMCYFLFRARRRSLVPHTKHLLRRIMALTIETNALTATIAILTLILFVRFTNNTLYLCPPYVLGKLYTNTLLVIFNNRIQLPGDEEEGSRGLKIVAGHNQSPSASGLSLRNRVLVTVIHETATEEVDLGNGPDDVLEQISVENTTRLPFQ